MKIAIYSRKSKFTGIGESIENQIQMCKDYSANKFNDGSIEYSIFEDEGFTGSNINRPEFKKMMKSIKEYDVLICYRLDRISRNVADFSSTLEILQANNCDFISIKEQFDTSSPMGRAMIYIASVFAQLERETIAERVKDNMLEMGKRGLWTGGRTPAGYDSESTMYLDNEGNERKAVKLVKNEEELKLVKQIYDVYLQEGSLHKTEVWFTQHNIKSNRGILLEKTSLKLILQNPVYVKANDEVLEWLKNDGWNVYGTADGIHGLLSYNKTESISINGKTSKRIKDKSEWIAAVSTVEGVIEPETWIKVQEQFNKNRDTFPNLSKTHNAMLTGKLKCALCGSNMVVQHGRVSVKTGEKLFYYICSMKKRSKRVICDNKNIKADEIEASVIYELEKLYKCRTKYINDLKQKSKEIFQHNNIAKNKLEIEHQILKIDGQINRLVDKLSLDDSLEDIFIKKIKLLKEEKNSLEEKLYTIDEKIKNDNSEMVSLEFISMLLDKCKNISKLTREEQKEIIDLLIDDIEYNGDTGEVSINIIGSKKK